MCPQSNLPPPWREFLDELDQLLPLQVELHCTGGFVLTAMYTSPRPTEDLDYVHAAPWEAVERVQDLAGPGSALAKKHKLYAQYVPVAEVPEHYADRLLELFPGAFRKLHLRALEVHDVVLAKLTRNSPVDRAACQQLAKAGALNAAVLCERYERELRPNLANVERHDLTLRLWLDFLSPGGS